MPDPVRSDLPPDVRDSARLLAERLGVSPEEALRLSVEGALAAFPERTRGKGSDGRQILLDAIRRLTASLGERHGGGGVGGEAERGDADTVAKVSAIQRRVADLPILSDLSEDAALGFDDMFPDLYAKR